MTDKFIAKVINEGTVTTAKHTYVYSYVNRTISEDGKVICNLTKERRNSKTIAAAIINAEKDDTCYFDGTMGIENMERLLYNKMGFGIAETRVIIAALQLAGGKFHD